MKNNFKILFLLLGAMTLLFTCQKESNDMIQDGTSDNQIINELPYLTSKMNYEEFSRNSTLISSLNRVQYGNTDGQSNTSSSRLIFVPNYNFFIDTDEASYLESLDGSYHSYTFQIYKNDNEHENLLQNLFFSYNVTNDDYDTFITTYYISNSERETLANNGYVNLEGKVSLEYLSDFDPDIVLNSLLIYIDTFSGTVTCWDDYSGTSQGTGWSIPGWEEITCPWLDGGNTGGDGDSSSTNSPGGSNTGNIPNGYEGSTNYWNSNDNPDGNGTPGGNASSGDSSNIATAPNINTIIAERKKTFRRIQLTTFQNSWFSNQPQETQDAIFAFLESQANANGLTSYATQYPQYAVDFVSLAIEALIDDIFSSFDEALNLFLDMDNDCQANTVIKFITQTDSPIVNVVTNVFYGNNTYNLQFEDVNLPSNLDSNALTSPPTNMLFSSSTVALITFDNNYLDSATNLSVVMTTAHEFVHVYMMYLYSTGNLLNYYPEFSDLNNAFQNFENNSSETNSELLEFEMHEVYDTFLDWIALSVFSYANNNNIEGATLEYCNKLVVGAHPNTDAYDALTPEQQIEYLNINLNEQDGTEQAKGTTCE